MNTRICACCRGWRGDAASEGVSSLYSPDREFTLCEPCFEDEERLIDATGTNEHPEILAMYAARKRSLDVVLAATALAEAPGYAR